MAAPHNHLRCFPPLLFNFKWKSNIYTFLLKEKLILYHSYHPCCTFPGPTTSTRVNFTVCKLQLNTKRESQQIFKAVIAITKLRNTLKYSLCLWRMCHILSELSLAVNTGPHLIFSIKNISWGRTILKHIDLPNSYNGHMVFRCMSLPNYLLSA